MGWWVADSWNNPALGPVWVVSWAVWVVLSICLHELAHGWAAIRLGDRTPIDSGHMTWNPLVHMGGFSLVMFALVGIAWGAMPVDTSRLRGRHADALVALAGPALNLALALLAFAALVLWVLLAGGQLSPWTASNPLYRNMTMFLFVGAMINALLLLLNLVPIPPLDGSRVLASFSRPYQRLLSSENARWLALGALLLVFWFGGKLLVPLAVTAVLLPAELIAQAASSGNASVTRTLFP